MAVRVADVSHCGGISSLAPNLWAKTPTRLVGWKGAKPIYVAVALKGGILHSDPVRWKPGEKHDGRSILRILRMHAKIA